jgi:predicted porin
MTPDATATSLSQSSWGLNWEHTFGNLQALAQWARVNNIAGCNIAGACNNTNASTWLAALRYNLSKRTGVYVHYTAINNDSNYNMDYTGGVMTSANYLGALPGLPPNSVGADPRYYGVGVMHNF